MTHKHCTPYKVLEFSTVMRPKLTMIYFYPSGYPYLCPCLLPPSCLIRDKRFKHCWLMTDFSFSCLERQTIDYCNSTWHRLTKHFLVQDNCSHEAVIEQKESFKLRKDHFDRTKEHFDQNAWQEMDPELLPRGLERAHLPGPGHEHPRAQPALPRGQWPAPSRENILHKA